MDGGIFVMSVSGVRKISERLTGRLLVNRLKIASDPLLPPENSKAVSVSSNLQGVEVPVSKS